MQEFAFLYGCQVEFVAIANLHVRLYNDFVRASAMPASVYRLSL